MRCVTPLRDYALGRAGSIDLSVTPRSRRQRAGHGPTGVSTNQTRVGEGKGVARTIISESSLVASSPVSSSSTPLPFKTFCDDATSRSNLASEHEKPAVSRS